VGDGTTSVIILAAEMMLAARPFLEREIHPSVIVNAYFRALEESQRIIATLAVPIDLNRDEEVNKALSTCVGTKFASRWGSLISDLALKATRIIMRGGNLNKLNLEVKRYAKIEKVKIVFLIYIKTKNKDTWWHTRRKRRS
jgi:T-complex protein 1 subunit gamma